MFDCGDGWGYGVCKFHADFSISPSPPFPYPVAFHLNIAGSQIIFRAESMRVSSTNRCRSSRTSGMHVYGSGVGVFVIPNLV